MRAKCLLCLCLPSLALTAAAVTDGAACAALTEAEVELEEAADVSHQDFRLLQSTMSLRTSVPEAPANAPSLLAPRAADANPADALAFVHVPYNFGHTVEKVALVGPGPETMLDYFSVSGQSLGAFFAEGSTGKASTITWDSVNAVLQPDGQAWGHLHPDLQQISNVTGCPMYFTPQKYWPQDLLEGYFGQRSRFGLLRDPYERLVAMFRGNMEGYGMVAGSEYRATCELDAGVRAMVKAYQQAKDPFFSQCTLIPQSEYWDGPYGINLTVDNRRFYRSINEVWAEYGVMNMNVTPDDIFHVSGCDNTWAGDLTPETKQLIQEVYARDFELICQELGHCDVNESVCLHYVPEMCPEKLFAWNDTTFEYTPRA